MPRPNSLGHQPPRGLVLLLVVGLVILSFCCCVQCGSGADKASSSSSSTGSDSLSQHERDYLRLHEATEDKDALEAIYDLHRQLDDDQDGSIEPSETGDFIRADLQYGSDKQRQKDFHNKDSEITVIDLWDKWSRSEVYNWTTDNVIDWLKNSVELPQYSDRFREFGLNGTHLPRAAISSSFLSKNLGVTNPIHRSKINLKAMDAVLFGPPRDQTNHFKDIILTTLLVIAVTGLFYAYRQNKRSQEHLRRMMHDMDSLSKAEQTLIELQEKLQLKDGKDEAVAEVTASSGDLPDAMEVSRLKEELEILRNELHRAEVELEDRCWMAPPVLQHWLQLTYEMETATYNSKKKAAEEQLEVAKDMCDKLKRKRSSLVGAFVSTHGRSIDDVDRSILDAKTALMELTKDLTERTQRWRQIEMLCGCTIVNNPGIQALQTLVRHVGTSRSVMANSQRSAAALSAKMSNSISQEDLTAVEDDSHSVAASSTHMSSRPTSSLLSSTLNNQHKKQNLVTGNKVLTRESSKDSSSSDELPLVESSLAASRNSMSSAAALRSSRAATPPTQQKSSHISDKRSKMMTKSKSQDAGGSIEEAASKLGDHLSVKMNHTMASSASESHLQQHEAPSKTSTSAASEIKVSRSTAQLSKPLAVEDLDDSSDTSSISSMDIKKKKDGKKRFFTFGRKKAKKDLK